MKKAKYLFILLFAFLPNIVLADNCSSLDDCYGWIGAAIVAVVLIGLGGGLLYLALAGEAIADAAAAGILEGALEEAALAEAASAATIEAAASAESAALAAGLSAEEAAIVGEAEAMLQSEGMATIRAAAAAGEEAEVYIGDRFIQYVPSNFSGLTNFEGNTFALGSEAFSSEAELGKTLLHELFRLGTSESAGGVSGALASGETQAAFNFAEKAIQFLF